MTSTQHEICVTSELANLANIGIFVSERARLSGMSEKQVFQVQMAVDEACTNAIRHAYQGRDDASIHLRLWTDPDAIVVELEDHGRPADAARIAPREISLPTQTELKPGGLGVQFIRQAFDDVVYHSEPHGGNRLTMRLRRPPHRTLSAETVDEE